MVVVIVVNSVANPKAKGLGSAKGAEVHPGYFQVFNDVVIAIGFEQGIDVPKTKIHFIAFVLCVVDCGPQRVLIVGIIQGHGGTVVKQVFIAQGQFGNSTVGFEVR